MRRFFAVLLAIASASAILASATGILYAQSDPDRSLQGIHERVRQGEESAENKRLRDAWIEAMHRTEPGLNWRAIDRENRWAVGALRHRFGKEGGEALASGGGRDSVAGVISGVWIERGSANQSGRIVTADVDIDAGVVYAASGGGNIWRGNIDGTGWRSLTDTMNVENIVMLRVVPHGGGKRIVMAGHRPVGVAFSDDDGVSWQRSEGLEKIAGWGGWKRGLMLDDSARTIYLLGEEWDFDIGGPVTVVYRSRNHGDSFEKVARFDLERKFVDLWTPRYGGGDIYIIQRDSVGIIHEDGTVTNVGTVAKGTDPLRFMNAYLVGSRAGGSLRLYAFLGTDKGAECYASPDGGATWALRDTAVNPYTASSIEASAVDPGVVFVGGVDLHKSDVTNGIFSAVSGWGEYYGNPLERLHADIFGVHALRDNDGKEFFLVCCDGGLYISRDTLRSVRNLSMSGLNVSQYYSTYTKRTDPASTYAGSQDQGYQHAVSDAPGPLDFTQVTSGDYGHLTSGDSGISVWSNYPGFTLFTREKGLGVQSLGWEFKGTGHLWLPPVVAEPAQGDVAWMVGGGSNGGSHLWRLEAGDTAISYQEDGFDFSNGVGGVQLSAYAISEVSTLRRYAATTDGHFYISTDGGVQWTMTSDSTIPGSHYFYGADILPSPVNPDRVYVAGSGYSVAGVQLSVDGGRHFTPITNGLPQTFVFALAVDPDERWVFAATEVGPFVYSVAQNEWHYLGGVSAPDQSYWSVEYIPINRTARFSTYGRGIWDFTHDFVSGVEDRSPQTNTPLTLSLIAAPNPVSRQTTISVTIPRSGRAVIRVYDIEGRMVARLFDGELEAGEHHLNWSPADDKLPAGTYTCVVNALGTTANRRIISNY